MREEKGRGERGVRDYPLVVIIDHYTRCINEKLSVISNILRTRGRGRGRVGEGRKRRACVPFRRDHIPLCQRYK